MNFRNPVKVAHFKDWPIGGANRGECKFELETNKRGTRVLRTTTNKHGAWCKPKMGTYGGAACFVTGDDGKVYILQFTQAASSRRTRRDLPSWPRSSTGRPNLSTSWKGRR